MSYARSGDVAIAYQVVGDGLSDLVLVPFHANIWSLWQYPRFEKFGQELAQGRRLIVVNPRGVGLSDRPRGFTIEARMDDLRSVLDAVSSERAAVLGIAESAGTCALFAASYPERVERLLLFCPYARGAASDEDRTTQLAQLPVQRERWGERDRLEELARHLNPQWADDPEFVNWFVWHQRLSSSPAGWADFVRMQIDLDITDVLSAVRVPTLVLSKERAREESAEVAAAIPGAVHVGLPGAGMSIWETNHALEAIEDFLRGAVPRRVPDTVLTTLLFTDLVGSTERATAVGDHAWRELLDTQRTRVRRELERYRGEEVDTAGDGFFVRFDGPARAIACARAVTEVTGKLGLELRSGIHTGECELVDGKPAGLSVHVAARVCSRAGPGEVLVSGTVRDLVAGSEIAFEERGEHELKGVPGAWRLYAVIDG